MFFSSSVDDNVSAVLEISSSTNDVSFAVFSSSSFCGRISVACNSTAYEDLWPQSASFAHL